MRSYTNTLFFFLIVALFIFRTLYGLVSEFWFEDELQIYLIGLKSYTTHTWPYYGPDVVYTNTQIPGALQGLLVSAGFYLLAWPESPIVLLNILSFSSLSLLAYYIAKRITTLPKWLIWTWVMTLTWTMNYSTRVVNTSYALIFSIPFFVCLIDLLPIYKNALFSKKLSFFTIGLTLFLIMQLHLSFVLLLPFVILVFFYEFKRSAALKEKIFSTAIFSAGALTGLLTVVPTWLMDDNVKSVGSNIVFNIDNYKNVLTVLVRYLSFASYEVPYILGGDNHQRLSILKQNIWMAPFALFLLLLGFLLVVAFVYIFFKNKSDGAWKGIKYLALFGYVLTFFSFFFSIKGPSSHTFYTMLPLPIIYSFHCYEWLWVKYRHWRTVMLLAVFSCFFFYTGLGIYNYEHKSLYKDRDRVFKAIEMKDHKILGERRSDKWGYGY